MADDLKPKPGHVAARVAFMAHRDLIQTDLNAGWSARGVYQRHSDKFGCISYRQFVRYAAELRPSKPTSAPLAPLEGSQSSDRKARVSDHKGIADPDLIRKLTTGR